MPVLALINARVLGKTILALATIDCALVGLGLILTPTTIRASGHGLLGVVAGLVMLAAKRLLVSGVTFVTAALIFYFIPGISVDVYSLGCFFLFAASFTIGLIQSIRYVKSLAGQNP